MSAAPTLVTKLAADWPLEKWRDVTVLIAVSGGADSVALARGLQELRISGAGRLVLAHFNHGLRGAESDQDQAFVVELARELGLTVMVETRGGEGESRRGGDAEEALRELRYRFLVRAADESGARYVATAHTADDQVETVLHNVIRGTGLGGLAGIPRLRPLTAAATLVRPLLSVSRGEVLAYLSSLCQAFREDATNQSLYYTRNRIRHELVPRLEREYNPQVRAALVRLSQIAGAADALLDQQAEELLCLAARSVPSGVEIDLPALEGTHQTLIQQALLVLWRRQDWPLQDMSFEKWEQLLALVTAPVNTRSDLPPQMFPGGVRAERRGNMLLLSRP